MLPCWQLSNANIAEAQISGRIMSLKADGTFPQLAAAAGIVVERTIICPVRHLDAIDPHGEMIPVGNNGHGEPFLILRHLKTCRLAAVDRTSAVVHGSVLDFFLVLEPVSLWVVFLQDVFLAL